MAINIDPADVTRAGNDLLDQTTEAKERIESLLATTVTAVTTHSGWDAAGALDSCRHMWQARLNTLVDQTSGTAGDLVDSATTISEADAEAAGRLSSVLDEMAGP